MKTIAIANHKGGVGKTTTAFMLAAGLKNKKKKVLLIDLDMQQNLSITCGIDLENDLNGSSLFDVLIAKRKVNINDCLFQIYDNVSDLDILVGNISEETASKLESDSLKNALLGLEKDYDYIIIDTPPYLGKLTALAISAADDLIIPVQPSKYSLMGIGKLYSFIDEVKPGINIAGLLLVGINERTNVGKKYINDYKEVAKAINSKLFKTMIHVSVAILGAQNNDETIFEYAPRSTVAMDYKAFVDEYTKGSKK